MARIAAGTTLTREAIRATITNQKIARPRKTLQLSPRKTLQLSPEAPSLMATVGSLPQKSLRKWTLA